ncbi:MAG: FAD binding domain-containing protein, partial [Spirochaetia bacterium]
AASLRQIGNYIIRNMGTIGGNLCYKPDRLNAFPVCFALNASAELRTARKSRWTSFQSFITKGGKPDIREGEIMTRIRIPLDTWDYAEFKTTNTPFGNTGTDFSFCGLANVQKQVIQDIRLVFGHVPFGVIRFRDAELQLSGRKLPINFKDIEGLQEILNTRFSQLSAPLSDVYRRLINNSFQWFLHRISYP